MKANLSYILFIFYLFCIQVNGQKIDSIKPKVKSPIKVITDSIPKDSVKIKKRNGVSHIVTHNADGYVIQNAKKKKVTLYDKAYVVYNDINLKAGKIIIDYDKNLVFATGIYEKDSVTDKLNYEQLPIFKQGGQESEQDSIAFNFKTKKALVYGVKTQQGEMLVYGEKTKRVNDSTIYMRNIRFTTSPKKNPDYYITTNKAKLVPGKKIIVGASRMVIADVPTPLFLPFAYFPLHKDRTSGFLLPSWGDNNQQGFFLQNGGYYFVVNDYLDLDVTGDIYTNGSWATNLGSNYYVKYKYSGNLRLSYQNLINSFRGFSDYRKEKNFNISWSHNQDSKSSPNSRLSATVNAGTSKFFRESMNEVDAKEYLVNNMNSSISYYNKIVGTPFNTNISLTHKQNSNTESINMNLPSLQLNMDKQYPFKGKGGVKKNAFQKIGITYSMSGKYQINTTDDEFLTSKMWKEARSGIKHNLGASTNMKAFKYFTISPNASYSDVWYFDKIEKNYVAATQTVVNDTISKFNRFHGYNVGASLSTSRFGTFNFKGKHLKAIRHTVHSSISWGYTPDFAKHHLKTVQQSNDPNDILEYDPFKDGVYSPPSSGESNSLTFGLKNVLEAKVAPKEDSDSEEDRKITLLNHLNFSAGYNMVADSLKWSNVGFSAGTNLFNQKLNLTLSGSLNPYQVTSTGVKIDEFNPNVFRLETATLRANTSFSSKDFGKNKDKKEQDRNKVDDVYRAKIGKTSNEFAHELNNEKKDSNKITQLYNIDIPWNIILSYSSTYRNDGYKTNEITRHTLGFSGNLELSPKWKAGFASGYDFKDGGFTHTRLNFSRDLDSFRFNFTWVPFGDRTSYYFFIGIKSSMLSDLKWDKNKPPDKRLY